MADRYYDRTLKCGCSYSSDGGGGCMPCSYGYGCGKKGCDENNLCDDCIAQEKKCEEAHKEWRKSKDYKDFQRECYENNQ
jgi:hypothetical protein